MAINNGTILSRDGNGVEHQIVVSLLPGGIVTIGDDAFTRILAPSAAIQLALELIHATKRLPIGTISSTY